MLKNSLIVLVVATFAILFCYSLRLADSKSAVYGEEEGGGEQAKVKDGKAEENPTDEEETSAETSAEAEEPEGQATTEEGATAATEVAVPAEGAGGEGVEKPLKIGGTSLIRHFGIVGWIIVGLSMVSGALIIKNFVSLRRNSMLPEETQQRLEALFNERKIQDAMTLCKQETSLLAKVVGAGLSEIRSGYNDMQQIMQEVGEEESIKLHQDVGYLSLIGNIAPMLGLLGTVIGMITTFQTISGSETGITNPRELAGGIQHALLTTCLGLMVAIPTLASFAFLRNRIVKVMLEVGVITEELMSRFKTMRVAAPSSASNPKTPSGGQGGPATPTTPTRS